MGQLNGLATSDRLGDRPAPRHSAANGTYPGGRGEGFTEDGGAAYEYGSAPHEPGTRPFQDLDTPEAVEDAVRFRLLHLDEIHRCRDNSPIRGSWRRYGEGHRSYFAHFRAGWHWIIDHRRDLANLLLLFAIGVMVSVTLFRAIW